MKDSEKCCDKRVNYIENELCNVLQIDKNFFKKQELDRLKLEIKRVKSLCNIHVGCISRLDEALANIIEILDK